MAFQLAFGWVTEVHLTPQSYSERSEVYKFVALSARLACWSDSEAETRVANISIDLRVSAVDVIQLWRRVHWVVVKGEFSLITTSGGASSNPSDRSHTLKMSSFFFLFSFFLPFFLLHVSLYSHCWSFKASRGFCDNVFLIKMGFTCENSHRR